MKYNFVVKLAMSADHAQAMADIVGGLEVAVDYKIQITAEVNTELPDNLVTGLKDRIDTYFTDKLGEAVEVELASWGY